MLTVLGLLLVIVSFTLGRKRLKDWLLVYLFISVTASLIGSAVAGKKLIIYPVRLLSEFFKSSVLFDYLLLPITCVIYNQITSYKGFSPSLIFAFIFTIPMSALELYIERKTKYVEYIRWNIFYTFTSMTITFWMSKFFTMILNRLKNNDAIEKTTL